MLLTFLFIAAFGVLLALVALMGLFLGASGADLEALLHILLLGVVPTLVVVFGVLRDLSQEPGSDGVLGRIWRRLPRWVVVAFALASSLIFLAELAVFMVQHMSGLQPTWDYYVPILTGTFYGLAFCVLFTKVAPIPYAN